VLSKKKIKLSLLRNISNKVRDLRLREKD
jgi:hypothetical protein